MKQHPLSRKLRSSGAVSIVQLRQNILDKALADTVKVATDFTGRNLVVFDRLHLDQQITALNKSGLTMHNLLTQGIERALKENKVNIRTVASLNGSLAKCIVDDVAATKHYASSLAYYIQESLDTNPEYIQKIEFALMYPECLGYHGIIERWNTEEKEFWSSFLHTHVSAWVLENIDEKESTLNMLQTQHYSRGSAGLNDILERWWWAWAVKEDKYYHSVAHWLNLTVAQTQQLAVAAFLCDELNVNGPLCSLTEIIGYLHFQKTNRYADKQATVHALLAAHGLQATETLTIADCIKIISEVYQSIVQGESVQCKQWLTQQLNQMKR